MKQLTQSAYARAVEYIMQNARPLEKARFMYHFAGGSMNAVLEALVEFQNTDGGFGDGLEPDIRLHNSSVIATTIAFQHFREFAVAGDHPVVVNACRYLVDTYDNEHHNWPIVPPNVSDAPHAPWWTFKGDMPPINPRAEIAGYLLDYPDNFPEALGHEVVDIVVKHLLAHPDTMEMHDLQCYLRLLKTPTLKPDAHTHILSKLERIITNSVEHNPTRWQEYGLPPLGVASRPDSPFAALFQDAIELNLDFIIDVQGSEGGWMPPWSWGEDSSPAWERAKQEWSGMITLNNLLTLRAFGRLG
ncbi:MAG: hypothetical protein H6672_14420 [Anaerolineaceae bacterium]|nr:hypothetical protein [Anaerolineaceae bacterium]